LRPQKPVAVVSQLQKLRVGISFAPHFSKEAELNYGRMALAGLGGFVVYFVKSTMPFGMAAMFVAILALAPIYAMFAENGPASFSSGAQYGALIGAFAVGSFVAHNYVNLNIGLKSTAQQAVAYFFEWLAVGIVFGMIYRPAR
jgi:hypothetical protein